MSVNPTTPTPEDLIALSSYLDNELSASERAALEQRLSTDEGLRTELESLRETVELVRSLPHLKAPRNFTLDPTVYGAASQPNTVTFLSRKMIWRIGAVAGIAATFTLVFAIFALGSADNAADQTANERDQSVSMADSNATSNENFDQTTVAQTAIFVQATQVALSTTTESVQDTQDGTSRSFAATEVALEDDQSTKATSQAFSPTRVLSQTLIPPEDREEPSITTGADESNQDETSPVATQTLIATFDTMPTAVGVIASTATHLASNLTSQPSAGAGNSQEGSQGTGGQSGETTIAPEEESETVASLPPVSTFLSTSTPSPVLSATPSPTASPSTSTSPVAQSVDDSVPNVTSTAFGTAQSESAADALGDNADTSSTAVQAADESDVFSNDVDTEAVVGEESRDTDMAGPPVPYPELTLLREILDFLVEKLLGLISLFPR